MNSPTHGEPRRQLTVWHAVSVCVGMVIGAGIFSTTPAAAANVATSSGLLLAWAFGGALSLAGALCFAEMAAAARRLGLAGRLRMPGVTSAPFSALSAMDAVLLTSRWEGTSNVALEAQGCGVPVIATRAGGSAEAIAHGETGWIVDTSDASTIAERVVATLDDGAVRHRLRTAGPRFIAERFGLERMIDETLRIYGHCAPPR